MSNKSPVPKKISPSTLVIYGILAGIVLVLCIMVGAAMDYAVRPDGKLDISLLGNGLAKVMASPFLVIKALHREGSYAPKMGVLGLFAIGIFALYK